MVYDRWFTTSGLRPAVYDKWFTTGGLNSWFTTTSVGTNKN